MSTTAAEVLDLLRTHYLPENRPAGGLFAPEIASPDGRRRADLIWVPTTIAGRHTDTIVGHEVKVSRSDVLTELSDPTKADPWAQFCSRWWLVVSDPSLVVGLDIPDAWGVMAPPSGRRTRSMTILRPAPRLTPTGDLSPAVSRLAAYTVNRVETKMREAQREVEWRKREIERLQATVEELRRDKDIGGGASPHYRRLAVILAEVNKRTRGIGWWVREPDDEAVVEALVDHAALASADRQAREVLDRLLRDLDDPLKGVREHLANLGSAAPERRSA